MTGQKSVAVQQQWTRHYPDADTGHPFVTAIVTGRDGFLYEVGYQLAPGRSDHDIFTKKINPSGITVWEQTYNREGESDERAAYLSLDSAGNVVVAGYSSVSGPLIDRADQLGSAILVTIKYAPNGTHLWTAEYTETNQAPQSVTALATDQHGDVAVLGSVVDTSTMIYHGVTIKYSPSGVQQWAVYDSTIEATACFDALGNLLVAAYGVTTTKFDSSGAVEWKQNIYPESGSNNPTRIATDETGAVYVLDVAFDIAEGAYIDTWLIKYNSAGVFQWDTHASGANSQYYMLQKNDALFFNAGSQLVFCNRNGVVTRVVNCAADSLGDVEFLSLEDDGNLLAAGYASSNGTRAASAVYTTAGVHLEDHRYTIGPPIDINGGFLFTGNSSGTISVLANNWSPVYTPSLATFDRSGHRAWIEPTLWGSIPVISASTLDREGHLICTGRAAPPSSLFDYLTIKYDVDGTPMWAARYNGPADSVDMAMGVAVDALDNVYVVGSSQGQGTGYDIATIKYDANGVQQWVARYDGPASMNDMAVGIALDSLGYVYVTGSSEGQASDFVTIKYTPSGTQQWATRYNGPSDGNDSPLGIVLDKVRNVYVAGTSDTTGAATDLVTIKYDAFGQELWRATYNGPANGEDRAVGLALNPKGGVYVGGFSDGAGTRKDYVLIKYSAQGAQQWVARYDDTTHFDDYATAVSADREGNAYITGYANGNGTSEDYTTVSYDSAGSRRWVAAFDGSAHGSDYATSVVSDGEGGAYMTGDSYSQTHGDDIVTLRCDSSGSRLWTAKYPSDNLQSARRVDVSPSGDVYVSGGSFIDPGAVWTVIKYSQTQTVSVEAQQRNSPATFRLEQNYPNPFNPTTVVSGQWTADSRVRLAVYDILGREVAVLADGRFPAGRFSFIFDGSRLASGVYFYTLTVGSMRLSRSMMLLK